MLRAKGQSTLMLQSTIQISAEVLHPALGNTERRFEPTVEIWEEKDKDWK